MIGWVDASSGASGDMLLGALAGAGVPLGVMADAVEKVAPGEVGLVEEQVHRGGFAATRCHVEVEDSHQHRTWRDVELLLADAGLHENVRSLAHDVFARLAEAEGRVHGMPAEDVQFHEVGALDAIADVVGACAGMIHLGLQRLVVSEVSVGGGTVSSEHGRLPVPPPAVVELLRGVPSSGGPPALELCTPTGAALLTTLADDWGPQPAMVVSRVGVGAGRRDPEGHANVLRLLVGERGVEGGLEPFETVAAQPPQEPTLVSRRSLTLTPQRKAGARSSTTGAADILPGPRLLETNIDDLDPRIWPVVIAALLEAGASDVWLTPILMKKGRPAHTLSVLVAADRAAGVRREIHRQTSTIGMREQAVEKHELDREMTTVEVDGHTVAVKVARLDGEVLNVQPEFEDVAAAARALGRPVKTVMSEAVAAAQELA